MLSSCPSYSIHIRLKSRPASICQRSTLNCNQQRCMSAIDEVVIVQMLSPTGTITAKNLSNPPHLTIYVGPDRKLHQLIGSIFRLRLPELSASAIHLSKISKLAKIYYFPVDFLLIPTESLLSEYLSALIVIHGRRFLHRLALSD